MFPPQLLSLTYPPQVSTSALFKLVNHAVLWPGVIAHIRSFDAGMARAATQHIPDEVSTRATPHDVIRGPRAFYFHDGSESNFEHFLVESLPRIAFYLDLVEASGQGMKDLVLDLIWF